VGEDTYLAEEALEKVLAAAVGEDRQDALRVFYGDEAKWEEVLAAARTGSLFATRRAIVVRRADRFAQDRGKDEDGALGDDATPDGQDEEGRSKERAQKDKGKDERVPADKHPLIVYLKDPNPDVTLVLVAAKPDRRRAPWSKFFKAMPNDALHPASRLKGRALEARVAQEIRARGLQFERQALTDLVGEVGQDLHRLSVELDKLEAWIQERRVVTADDIDSVLGQGIARPLYVLGDAFAGRDKLGSITLVEELLADRTGNDALGIALKTLARLYWSLRQVRAAAAMREARVPRDDIGAKLLPPNMQFKLDALLEASRRWTEAELRRGLAALGRADRRMKRGGDAATTLVAAIAESCGGETTSPRRGR
jgi:DNA polymerase III delta subunit